MAQLNANTPYIHGYIRNCYIFGPDDKGLTEGYIFGVKSMINRPMHFHFQSSFGAVFWNMPISAFVHKKDYDKRTKSFEHTLENMPKTTLGINPAFINFFPDMANE